MKVRSREMKEKVKKEVVERVTTVVVASCKVCERATIAQLRLLRDLT